MRDASAGTLQIAFAVLRADALVRFLPYPFLAGFTTGVAALIVLGQMPALLGITKAQWQAGWPAALEALHPGALALGLATAAAILWLGPRPKRAPPTPLGVGAGLAVYALAHALWPSLSFGAVIGTIDLTSAPRVAAALLPAHAAALVSPHLPQLVITALLIAVLSSLQGLLYAVAVDAQTGHRRDLRRELLAGGIGNVVSGLAGGISRTMLPPVALAVWRAGGRTWVAHAIAVVLLAATLAFGAPLLAYIPLALLAGAMLTIALNLVDQWTRALFRRLRAPAARQDRLAIWSAVIVVVVALATIFTNFAVALAVGLVLSMALFFVDPSARWVRAIVDGNSRLGASLGHRRDAGHRARAWADAHRGTGRSAVLRLRRPPVRRLIAEEAGARPPRRSSTLSTLRCRLPSTPPARSCSISSSGASASGACACCSPACPSTAAMAPRCWRIAPSPDRAPPAGHRFPDVDRAMEFVERAAAAPAGASAAAEIPLAELGLRDGLDDAGLAVLATALERHARAAGAVLFREGEAGDRMYVLARGLVTITIRRFGDGEGRIDHDRRQAP